MASRCIWGVSHFSLAKTFCTTHSNHQVLERSVLVKKAPEMRECGGINHSPGNSLPPIVQALQCFPGEREASGKYPSLIERARCSYKQRIVATEA